MSLAERFAVLGESMWSVTPMQEVRDRLLEAPTGATSTDDGSVYDENSRDDFSPSGPDHYSYKNRIAELSGLDKQAAAVAVAERLVAETGRHSMALLLYARTLARHNQRGVTPVLRSLCWGWLGELGLAGPGCCDPQGLATLHLEPLKPPIEVDPALVACLNAVGQ